jgi:hypothetical protein
VRVSQDEISSYAAKMEGQDRTGQDKREEMMKRGDIGWR